KTTSSTPLAPARAGAPTRYQRIARYERSRRMVHRRFFSILLDEQTGDGRLLVDVLDGLPEQLRHGQGDDLLALRPLLRGMRDRIGDDQLRQRALLDLLDRGPREHRVRAGGEHLAGPRVLDGLRDLAQRARGVHDVVHDERGAALDV